MLDPRVRCILRTLQRMLFEQGGGGTQTLPLSGAESAHLGEGQETSLETDPRLLNLTGVRALPLPTLTEPPRP